MKVVTAAEMRQIEQAAAKEGISEDTLMENAGLAVARTVRRLMRDGLVGKRVAVLVGPGNNGGDGLVAARHLAEWGADVLAVFVAKRPQDDPNTVSAQSAGVQSVVFDDPDDAARLRRVLNSAEIALDAVLGTGRRRPLEGLPRDVLTALEEARVRRASTSTPLRVVALDLPSGVDADTGATDPAAPHADLTVTLGYPKTGLFLYPAAERVGKLEVLDIGIPSRLAEGITVELVTPATASTLLPKRPAEAHKGTFGRVLVVGGSRWYTGAPVLAAQGAQRAGAGLVELAAPASVQPMLAARTLESIHLPLPEFDGVVAGDATPLVLEAAKKSEAVLIGCGMAQSESARAFMRATLAKLRDVPLVLDADGLNNLAQVDGWPKLVQTPAVFTPHVGEMSRLVGRTAADINTARIDVARNAGGCISRR